MKTRIFSGALLILIVALVLIGQTYVPLILVSAIAIIAAIGVYEALYSTEILKNKLLVSTAMTMAVIIPFAFMGYINIPLNVIFTLYIGAFFVLCLKVHSTLNIASILGAIGLPIIISYSFSCLCYIIQKGKMGIFYLLLVLCWSAIADTGAYFVGVLIGKHKMAKIISPKKSWEGLFGGMISSLIFVFLLSLLFEKCFGYTTETLYILLMTPVFVLLGVVGDLSASLIKRQCNIKDFGKLIPGHGGILDRFDSILMISPFFMMVLSFIQLIK